MREVLGKPSPTLEKFPNIYRVLVENRPSPHHQYRDGSGKGQRRIDLTVLKLILPADDERMGDSGNVRLVELDAARRAKL